MITENEKSEIEQLIDREGLDGVLQALGEICGEKCDHIRASYADRTTANAWHSAGAFLFGIVDAPAISRVAP